MKKYSISPLLLIYCFFSMTTIILWNQLNHSVTAGDEPHYLIIADGIKSHFRLEQSLNYKKLAETGESSKFGLTRVGANALAKDTHSVIGPHGQYSVHNIGLPLLLIAPSSLAGVAGAKLFMIFCGGMVIFFSWKISEIFSKSDKNNFLAVLAVCISMPLIPAVTQIYPEVLAGLISIMGLYWYCTTQNKRPYFSDIVFAAALAFLPWLQIKFIATCFLILLAVMVKIHLESGDVKRIMRILPVVAVSFSALLAYNFYAFGKISGPYQAGALEISRSSLMVLLGLHVDQNQGFLLQNPVNFVGVMAMGWLYRQNRQLFLLWLLVFLSLIVPNALHPNWYGGWSFAGRFSWAAAIVFMIPTIYGLLEISEKKEKIFFTIVTLSTALQLHNFYIYSMVGTSLYNQGGSVVFNNYSIFYSAIYTWLPGLYNADWAFSYLPNYAWLVFLIVLSASGFLSRKKMNKRRITAICVSGVVILIAGCFHSKKDNELVFQIADLPSQTGRVEGKGRIVEPGTDAAGFINTGPYVDLAPANYKITVSYSSLAAQKEVVMAFDIYNSVTDRFLLKHELFGTNGTLIEFTADFKVTAADARRIEFRNRWLETKQVKLYKISVRKMS